MKYFITVGGQFASVVILLATLSASAAFAAGDVLLTLTDSDSGTVIEMTEADLLALEQFTVLTENEFVDGLVEFSGPLARDVVALLNKPEFESLLSKQQSKVEIQMLQ